MRKFARQAETPCVGVGISPRSPRECCCCILNACRDVRNQPCRRAQNSRLVRELAEGMRGAGSGLVPLFPCQSVQMPLPAEPARATESFSPRIPASPPVS